MYIDEFRLANGRNPNAADYALDVLRGNVDGYLKSGRIKVRDAARVTAKQNKLT